MFPGIHLKVILTVQYKIQEINNIRFEPLQLDYGSYFLLGQQGLGKTFAALDLIYQMSWPRRNKKIGFSGGLLSHSTGQDMKKRLEDRAYCHSL